MKPKTRAALYKVIGILLCTVPAAVTALFYFPLWVEREDSTWSVISVLVLCLCALPLRRVIARALKSPSAWQMWLALWIGLTLFESICTGLRAIACVAFPFSIAGAVFFRLAKRTYGEAPQGKEDNRDGE